MMEHGIKKLICVVLGITPRSYSNYVNQQRPIIKLLDQYFTKEDLQEFLDTGKIAKQELIKGLAFEDLQEQLKASHNDKIKEEITKKFEEIEALKELLK